MNFYTDSTIEVYKEACKIGWGDRYDMNMGNFRFTEAEITIDNLLKILSWLENHNNYAFIYESCEDYGDYCWWLTPKSTL